MNFCFWHCSLGRLKSTGELETVRFPKSWNFTLKGAVDSLETSFHNQSHSVCFGTDRLFEDTLRTANAKTKLNGVLKRQHSRFLFGINEDYSLGSFSKASHSLNFQQQPRRVSWDRGSPMAGGRLPLPETKHSGQIKFSPITPFPTLRSRWVLDQKHLVFPPCREHKLFGASFCRQTEPL